jgi:arylsulfatase A-like enzyme
MDFLDVLLLFSLANTFCSAQPNIVVFMVDDLGVADIGCFGNDTIKTPNIDKLATEGARLTHNLSPESVCTPSRAAFLTGRYAIRSGLAANPGKIRMFLYVSVHGGLPQNETTFAEVLQDAGYATGMIYS